MATLYYTKRFETGVLKGLGVHCAISFPSSETKRYAKAFRIGAKGKDAVSGNRWTVVDASFQNYVR